MLRELVEAAERFAGEDDWLPAFYDRRMPNWIVEVSPEGLHLSGPFKKDKKGKKDRGAILVPVRYRSGKAGKGEDGDGDAAEPEEKKANLKPLLLADKAAYVFGIRVKDKESETKRMHRAYCELLDQAFEATRDEVWRIVSKVANAGLPAGEAWQKIRPNDLVASRRQGDALFPCETDVARIFWKEHIKRECMSEHKGTCGICGTPNSQLLQTLPQPVFVLEQKCQITSFNQPSFRSFGKGQTTNGPICGECAAAAIQTFNYLCKSDLHRATLARDDRKGQSKNPLRTLMALFWTRKKVSSCVGGLTYDFDRILSGFMAGTVNGLGEPQDEASVGPPPDESQLETLLKLPWSGEDTGLTISGNAFHLAVLSANKGRLVVRDWMSVSLTELKKHLKVFVHAMRIVGPNGEPPRLLPLKALIEALRATNADVPRGLLRTAYAGRKPPECLQPMAVHRFPHPMPSNERSSSDSLAYVAGFISTRQSLSERKQDAAQWALAASIKLVITFGSDNTKQEEARKMETLDATRNVPAYLCGRLLAILEGIQMQAADWKINATLVDRAYGTAATAPASIFGQLIGRAESAHLPKIKKKYSSVAEKLKALCDDIGERLKAQGGFPLTLALKDQAEFALGFYCQRAELRRNRPRKSEPATEHKEEAEA